MMTASGNSPRKGIGTILPRVLIGKGRRLGRQIGRYGAVGGFLRCKLGPEGADRLGLTDELLTGERQLGHHRLKDGRDPRGERRRPWWVTTCRAYLPWWVV